MVQKKPHLNFRLPGYMYADMKKLGTMLHLKEDSKIIRFCIVYTISSLSKLDKVTVVESLGLAIGDMMFADKDDDQ